LGLGAVLGAVMHLARGAFVCADELRLVDARARADNQTCVAGLEPLLRELLDGRVPGAHDLLHALGPLIMQLVQVEAALRAAPARRNPAAVRGRTLQRP
jgi:hypothetical protein